MSLFLVPQGPALAASSSTGVMVAAAAQATE